MFLVLLIVIFFLFILVFNYIITKKIITPLTIFVFLWLCIVIFSCLSINLYGIFSASNKSYFIIFIGVLFFTLGYIFNTFFKRKKRKQITYQYNIRYKLLVFFNVICSIFYLYVILNIFENINNFNLWSIQQYIRVNHLEFISSNFLRLINSFILGPVSVAIPIICAVDIVFGKKDKRLFFSTMIMSILKLISTASRSSLLLFFVYIIILISLKITLKAKSKKESSLKNMNLKFKIFFLVLFILGIFAFLSFSRNISFVKGIVLNLSIQPNMLDIWINKVDTMNIRGYGRVFFSGFFFLIGYPIKIIFNIKSLPFGFQKIYDLMDLTVSQWVNVGSNVPANAYVSIFWYNYLDGGYIGIMIEMFLIGLIAARIYNSVDLNNKKSLSNYCLIIFTILFSFIRLQFAQINFFLVILFINTFLFKKDIVKEEFL